jgi:hypothetical protein
MLLGMTVYASDGTKTTPTEPTPELAEELPLEVVEAEPVDPEPEKGDPAAGETLPAVLEVDILDGVPEWTHQADWDHAWIDFEGDRLAFRVPKPSAVTGFSNSQGKYVPNREKGDHVQLFLRLHLSPESYERVIFRMMHPESTYDLYTLAKLVEAILTPGVEALEAELKDGPKDAEPATEGKSS